MVEPGGMSKIDEVLEIKALRRVISAYLNYSSAAEEDIKRWQRSYSKLSTSQKAMLPHLPTKYQELRRCVKTNSYFLTSMLQAFEPPFEMGDGGGDYDIEDAGNSESHASANGMHLIKPAATVRDEEYSIGQTTYHNPARDSSVAVTNSNKRQAIESSVQGKASDSEIFKTPNSAFRTAVGTGSVRSREDWSTTLSEARAMEQEEALARNGGSTSGRDDHGYPMGTDMKPARSGSDVFGGVDLNHPCYQLHVPAADVDKVRCIVRNIVRDWCEEGALEREHCYNPILLELHRCFPDRNHARQPPNCLVPGAGLGRLACEISRLGFVTQGNEFSYYMLMCSSFILNQTQESREWTLHPWIHTNCNNFTDKDQLRPVRFPDLHPGSAGITEGFSMCAGDFVEVYSHPSQAGAWDALVSCFFIDTAHNVVEYLEVIARALKPGGIWINLGPLLYHFADSHSYSQEEEMSLELSLEDVKKVAAQLGLVLKTERMVETTYTANSLSMMQNRYLAALWTMVKEQPQPAQHDLPPVLPTNTRS